MEFLISTERLAAELGKMMNVLSCHLPVPVLENILISSTGGNCVEFVASNLETTLRNRVQVEQLVAEGQLLVPAKQFHERARLLPSGVASIKLLDNGWVQMKAGRTKFDLPASNADDYPALPGISENSVATFPARLLKTMLDGVIFAIPPEEDVRYILKGVKFESDANGVRMVAADGHRLSFANGQNEDLQPEDLDVLIPEQGLSDLRKLVGDAEATVIRISKDNNNIYFQDGTRSLSVRLLEGKFPNYNAIIENAKEDILDLTFEANSLAQSLRRAKASADSNTNAVLFNFTENELKLTAQTSSTGSAEEILDAPYSGEPMKINLNSKYVAEYLAAVDGTSINFGIRSPEKPALLRTIKDGVGIACVIQSMDPPDED